MYILSEAVVRAALKRHGLEVWFSHAVEIYTRVLADGRVITGERFTKLADLRDSETLLAWLGY